MSAAISSGRPLRPRGDLNASIIGPTVGWSRPSWSNGVWIAPGATALRVIPSPAHSGVGACRRTHQLRAVLVTGYVLSDSPSPARARVAASSPSRQLAISASSSPGWQVVEFELIATAAASVPRARSGRSPASSSTVPK